MINQEITRIVERLRKAPSNARDAARKLSSVQEERFAHQVGLLEAELAHTADKLEKLMLAKHCSNCQHYSCSNYKCKINVNAFIYIFEDRLPCSKWEKKTIISRGK